MKAWLLLQFQTSRGEEPVLSFIKTLSPRAQSRISFLTSELIRCGPILGMPYSKKISNHLYELRIKGKEQVRIFYTHSANCIYLLHGFKKKSQRIPQKELTIAHKRQAQIDQI